MKVKGYVSIATNIADELDQAAGRLRPRAGRDPAQGPRGLHQGEADQVAQQRRREGQGRRAFQAVELELEQTKEKKLERQIERCTLKAPGDGIVVYANDPGRMGGQNAVQIEEGAAVRERQKIFSLPDTTKMRVNTKVHESMVDRIKVGQPALVRVDAAANEVAQGARSPASPRWPTPTACSPRTSRSTPPSSPSRATRPSSTSAPGCRPRSRSWSRSCPTS